MFRRCNFILLLLVSLLLSGCALRTVDQMYCLPKRSQEYSDLQSAIDGAMVDLEYSSPLSGENRQTVQMADLDGDREEEYLLFARGSLDKPMKILMHIRKHLQSGCLHKLLQKMNCI